MGKNLYIWSILNGAGFFPSTVMLLITKVFWSPPCDTSGDATFGSPSKGKLEGEALKIPPCRLKIYWNNNPGETYYDYAYSQQIVHGWFGARSFWDLKRLNSPTHLKNIRSNWIILPGFGVKMREHV